MLTNKNLKQIGMTLVCTVGVSAIYFIIALLDLFKINNITYFIIYLTGLLLFLGVRAPMLIKSCIRSADVHEFLIANYAALAILLAASIICYNFASAEIFTLFFSFTKVFKQLNIFPFNINGYISTLAVWLIYGVEIAVIAALYGQQHTQKKPNSEPVAANNSTDDYIDYHDDTHWARLAAEMAAEQLGELPEIQVEDNSDARRAARIAAEMLGSLTEE